MSIASQLQALEGNIEDAYDMVAQRGGTMPQRKNMENLDDAIATIPSATTPGDGTLTIQKNGTTLGTFTANQSSNETIDIDAADSVTMLYVSDMGRNPSSVTFYKDEEQTEAASAQFIKDAFLAGKVVIYDDEYYFFAEIVAASEDGYPGADITFKIETGWETPSSGTDPEPEIRYLYYSSFASTSAELSFVYLTQPFTGTSGVYNGIKGVVPAPASTDTNKFLKSNGAWAKVDSSSVVGGTSGDTLANGALVEVVGTTTGNSANYAWKYADGRLINFQHYDISGNATTAWGSVYSGVQMIPRNYAVAFTATPIVMAQLDWTGASGNCWLAQANEAGNSTVNHPGGYQLVRPTSYADLHTGISIVAYGFWK